MPMRFQPIGTSTTVCVWIFSIVAMNEESRNPVLVVSHERSGTHFLMNTLAAEFGYVSKPHADFDQPVVNINFFAPTAIERFFTETHRNKPEVIRKSHHQFDFFKTVFPNVVKRTNVFYIYRDPRSVAQSFRHFLNGWNWFEGPKVDTAGKFIRAEPAGQLLRYQYHQLPNMLQRWRVHVEGWVDAAVRYPEITLVRYEDLNENYDDVVDAIARKKAWHRQYAERPKIDENTILKSQRGSSSNRYTDDDIEFFRQEIGTAMRKLGYDI